MKTVRSDEQSVAAGNIIPGKSAGMERERVAGIMETIAILEAWRKIRPLGFVVVKIGNHVFMERQVGNIFILCHAPDRLVIEFDFSIGFVLEILANHSQGKKRQPGGRFLPQPLHDLPKIFFIPWQGRFDWKMIEGMIAQQITLAHRGIDIVRADENGDKIRPFHDDLVESLESVPGEITVDAVINELKFGQ
jgi:hypothetical protein